MAKVVYDEWLGNKKQAEMQGKMQKMQTKYGEEMQKEKKRQEAEQSYDIWLQKHFETSQIKKQESRNKIVEKSLTEAK